MVSLDPKFKSQFKLSFIKSLKSGFTVKDIKKSLISQYPKDLIEDLIEEFQADKDIIRLLTPKEKIKKPGFFERFFKISESKKIQIVTKIHSIYYNFIITEKRKISEKLSLLEEISKNLGNKKLISQFVKEQKSWIKDLNKRSKKLVNTAKELMNADLKSETKQELNNILEYIQLEKQRLGRELETVETLNYLNSYPEELRMTISKEKNQTKNKERKLQKKIEAISKKSTKFKEVISEL